MYDNLLLMHSWLRWIVLILAFFLLIISFKNWKLSPEKRGLQLKTHWLFLQAFRYQAIFGLVLFIFISPITKSIWSHPELIMSNPYIRFWVTQHVPLMIIAIGFFEGVGSRVNRQVDERKKAKLIFIATFIALTLVMMAIPWPFLSYGRVLFRG